jgi:DNA anti-recombination protein RmuC
MLDEYCRSKRVFPVSPNTFYACLNAFAISLQGQKIEERTRHILAGMSGLKKQFESCADVFERLGTHLRHAQQSYEEADSKLSRAGNSLEQLEQGALSEVEQRSLSETEQKALEPASEQARFSL